MGMPMLWWLTFWLVPSLGDRLWDISGIVWRAGSCPGGRPSGLGGKPKDRAPVTSVGELQAFALDTECSQVKRFQNGSGRVFAVRAWSDRPMASVESVRA